MAGLDDLAKRLDRIAVRVEGNVERAMKDCAQVVLRSVVEATPVDTGKARSNWTPELARAFEGLFPARVPGIKGSTDDANSVATIEAGAPVIEAFDIRENREIHITTPDTSSRSTTATRSKRLPTSSGSPCSKGSPQCAARRSWTTELLNFVAEQVSSSPPKFLHPYAETDSQSKRPNHDLIKAVL